MTRGNIKLTISIVLDMESIIINRMEIQLEAQNTQGGVPKRSDAPRKKRTLQGPDGQPRTFKFRAPQDQIDAVKDGCLSNQDRLALLKLAQSLPPITPSKDQDSEKTPFQIEATSLLSKSRVEIYEIKILLPIKESGELVSSNPQSGEKPAPEYTRVTSSSLLNTALRLGVISPPDSGS